jgi:hypothetical protein
MFLVAALVIASESEAIATLVSERTQATTSPAVPIEGEPVDPRLRIHTDRVDRAAVVQALELRVGPGWRRWSIDVDEGSSSGEVHVQLRDDAGHIHTRALTLEGETSDERSRALASSLALLVEQLEDGAAPPEPEPAPAPEPPRRSPSSGFLAVGPRAALNPGQPLDRELGASLVGGAWLARDHVQPVAELAWARSAAHELTVDAIRIGGGLLGGAATRRGRVWGGGGALMRAQWAQARASATATGWWANPAVVGVVQYRGRLLVAGAWVGLDFMLPPLLARGDAHELRWFILRPMVALHVGLRLPPRR